MPITMGTPLETLKYHLSAMPIVGACTYLFLVWALHKLMANRQPMAIPKPLMVLYNAGQVILNGYVAYVIAAAVDGKVWGIGLKDTPDVRYGVYLHFLCKYVDYIDTLLIVLRKKNEQLSFLHLWHHSTILLVWGWVVETWPTGAEGGSAVYCYGAWVNACVHVIMYFYYGLTSVGIKPPSPIKKAVTTVQLTQFASCITIAVAALFLDDTPVFYNGVQVMYHIGMLRLFLPLLLKKPAAGGKGKGSSGDVARTPAQKETVKAD